jgi:D-aspartate ligase
MFMSIEVSKPAGTARDKAELPNYTVGAVVVGGDYQGLGIVRSLGRHKVPVCVIDDERSIARYSRYTTHYVRVRSLRDEKVAVDQVLEIGKRLGLKGWVLFPTRDETVAAFARYRTDLKEFFRVPTPEWDTTQWVWDKRNTYQRARDLGIPTPCTWYVTDAKELEKIDAEPPYVLKPAIKEHFIYSTKAKAWRANNRTELRDLYQRAAALVGPGEMMIQALIPGDGRQQFAYCALQKEGRALGKMVVRRTRQHPHEFGRSSTYVETLDIPILEELSQRFLKSINYYGLVELEYKLDTRDGQYKLLDVNGRTWGYHTLGYGAGVDFPFMLYTDQIGMPVESHCGKVGVRWIRLVTDVPTGVLDVMEGRQKLWDYLRTLKGIDVESVFSSTDPMPGLVELALLPYLMMKRGF